MSEHELWNELGNLYFLSGSFDQAIHAYTRSISLDKNYGRPYGNMALAYVQKGKFTEAIDLYRRGIRLLTEDQEKAQCWYKLGNVYRHLKDYRQAVEAYQKADQLVPDLQDRDEAGNKADALLNRKPTVDDTLPSLDEAPPASAPRFESIPLPEELTPWFFDEQFVPDEEPMPAELEGWFEEVAPIAVNESDKTLFTEPLKWDLAPAYEMAIVESEPALKNEEPVMVTAQLEVNSPVLQLPAVASEISAPIAEAAMQEVTPVEVETLVVEETPAPVMIVAPEMELIPEEIVFHAEDVTSPEAVQYEAPTEVPVVDIPSVQLTPAELDAIEIDIMKFRRVLDINPNNPFAWDTIGGLYKTTGQYNEAILAYQKATELDPEKAFYWHHLGLVYAADGRYEDAITAFQKVIEIDPNYSLAHATLGGYYRKRGMEELAQAHIEKAKSLLGVNENEYNRACMEAICGNSDRALELLEIALKNKQTYVNWAKRDPDLDFIRSDPRFHALLSEHATRPTQ